MISLHEKLKQLRKERGLSQQDLAFHFGYKSFTTIQKWEDGSSLPPTKLLTQLSEFYHISVEELMSTERRVAIPILGTVRGGALRYASQEFKGVEYVDEKEGSPEEHFYLEVIGDSMINARIYPEDLVYVHRQDLVENGAIAVILVGEEATIKRVFYEEDKLILKPENPKYQAMIYTQEECETKPIRILGKVIHCKIKL
jgi:repressor LexA